MTLHKRLKAENIALRDKIDKLVEENTKLRLEINTFTHKGE